MEIRKAIHGDIEKINHLYEDFYAYNASQQPEYCSCAKENGRYPTSVIRSKRGAILVAETDGNIVGFIHIEKEETPAYPSVVSHRFANVIDFFVIQECRHRGIGKLLLDAAAEWAKARELEYLELFVLEENFTGRHFYEREGFATTSRTMRMKL